MPSITGAPGGARRADGLTPFWLLLGQPATHQNGCLSLPTLATFPIRDHLLAVSGYPLGHIPATDPTRGNSCSLWTQSVWELREVGPTPPFCMDLRNRQGPEEDTKYKWGSQISGIKKYNILM